MLCEKCKKKEASVFYEETINGSSRSYSLCADCAAEMETHGELPFSKSLFGTSVGSFADDLFGGLFAIPDTTRTSRKLCPLCHASLESLKRSGRAGCPQCYDTFADELRGSIRAIHGAVKHIGKAPKTHDAPPSPPPKANTQLDTLKDELKTAISEENFEKAAELRDRIRAIEQEG